MHKILFIGGAGFIGASILHEIINSESDIEVFVLEPYCANVERLNDINVEILRGKLSDIDFVKKVLDFYGITHVVHLVSTMVPGCDYEDYEREFENVIFPTIRLMKLCSQKNIQFVYFSSGGTVYGERKNLMPFVETDSTYPISYYGLSKQVIENSILFEHRTNRLKYLILRPSNPYGHGQNIYGRQGLIAVALGNILSHTPITIWGDGSSVRDYIYIDDLAKIFLKLINRNISNKIFNIGSGVGYSITQIIEIMKDIVDEDVLVQNVSSRKSDVSNMILNNNLVMNATGNMVLTSIEDGIKQFYEYEKKYIDSNE